MSFDWLRSGMGARSGIGIALLVLACDPGDATEAANAAGAASTTGGSSVGAGGSVGSVVTGGSIGTPATGGTPGVVAGSGGSAVTGGAPASGGTASSDGTAGSAVTAGSGGSTEPPPAGGGTGFTLAWEDDFDALDLSRWALQTHSWDGNLALFSAANASVNDGILSIALTPEPSDTLKPYRGVELRSIPTVTYGKVEARVRFAKGSGVVSSLVLIYTPWPADDWNEIDIEHLGKTSDAVQLNCMVYTGPPTTPPVAESVTPTQDPAIASLGFDATADFHIYEMEWTPEEVVFRVDGAVLRTWTAQISRMRLPQNVLFTIWASGAPSWAGPITAESAPTTADIDWIKVYSLERP